MPTASARATEFESHYPEFLKGMPIYMIIEKYINSLKGKHITFIGAGISNKPLIELMLSNNIDVTVCDKQTFEELGETALHYKNLGAKLILGDNYLKNIDSDIIFRTPGIMPWKEEIQSAVRNGAVLTSEMEVFFELCPCKIIGITGSDGKTTTTSLIGELLRNSNKTVHVGGNIGNPLLTKVDKINFKNIAVLELSSFQLISMRSSPHISVVTNLSPNHLDVHNDMAEYVDAKRNIVKYQTSSDTAVLNYDYAHTRAYADSTNAKVIFFSRKEKLKDGVYLDNDTIVFSSDNYISKILPISKIVLPGLHNVENYMAAIAALYGMIDVKSIKKTAREFCGVKHRIEFIKEINGAKYYNDSIATTPSRSMAALKAFGKKVILIAGGRGKDLPYDEFAESAIKYCKAILLIGEEADSISNAVKSNPGFNSSIDIQKHATLENAIDAAYKMASTDDVVLFSPACASFDMFKNFEDRGDKFREIVEKLVLC